MMGDEDDVWRIHYVMRIGKDKNMVCSFFFNLKGIVEFPLYIEQCTLKDLNYRPCNAIAIGSPPFEKVSIVVCTELNNVLKASVEAFRGQISRQSIGLLKLFGKNITKFFIHNQQMRHSGLTTYKTNVLAACLLQRQNCV